MISIDDFVLFSDDEKLGMYELIDDGIVEIITQDDGSELFVLTDMGQMLKNKGSMN